MTPALDSALAPEPGPHGTFVPPSVLMPPHAAGRRTLVRDAAAFLLDRHLRRLARLRNPVELRLARLLRRLADLSGYLDLGFARLADYATERLGISVRRAQALVQTARRLDGLPAVASAFEAGRISQSQVLLLLRVVKPESEGFWLERAGRLNVRLLEREVRQAEAAGGLPAVDPPDGADEEEGDAGREVSFCAPGAMRARWEWAVEACRRAAGSADPVWRAAEHLAADYLSGVAGLPALLRRQIEDAGGGAGREAAACVAAGGADRRPSPPGEDEPGVDLFEEVRRGLEEEHGGGDALSDAVVGGTEPDSERFVAAGSAALALARADEEETAGDPRRLDARLRALVRLRQDLAWHQGRLLLTFTRFALYRDLGFHSFARYCRERLGLGLRRARRLIALERRLAGLPALARAYREGRISWVQASEVARVADETNEAAWLHLARSVTVRRLREEVVVAASDLESDGPPRAARPGRRRGDPAGVDASGRVGLRSPWSWSAEAPGVQSSASGEARGDGDGVPGPAGVQSSAPAARPDSGPMTRIRFFAPAGVADLWQHALRVCRLAEGREMEDWECVDRMIDSLERSVALRSNPKWRRRYRVFERDGWRCRAPGCTSRRNLQEHHVVYRSHGGGDGDDNLVALCATHHLQGIHAGRLRCHGLPDGLVAWELGPGPDGQALERYVEDVRWDEARRAVAEVAAAPREVA